MKNIKNAALWFWHLEREKKGHIIISIYISILVTAITIDHASKPIEVINTVHAQEEELQPALIEVDIDWTKERIDREIQKKAEQYGTSATALKRIVQCESGYVTDIQSGHMLSYGREKSYGLAQIHLPSHPEITYEQAIDPAFAIDYLAKHYARGTDRWSCK